MHSIVVIALMVLISSVVLDLLSRMMLRRSLVRLVSKIKFKKQSPATRLHPECLYVVHFDDVKVKCVDPQGVVAEIAWADLQRVEIVTNDLGPFLPDVFWVLQGTRGGCFVPQGATGEVELRDRLHSLPRFNFEAAIAAMSSTANQRFSCWQKEGSNDGQQLTPN